VQLVPEIWDRAVDLQRQREARRPDDAGVQRCAERLRSLAGDQDVLDYLWQRAETMDLSSPFDGATLWAWRSRHPSTGDFVGNRYVAQAWAEHVTRLDPAQPATVIHLTPGGTEMDQHWLNDRRTIEALDLDPDDVREVWDRLSERYAENIHGRTVVFSDHAHTAAILYSTELPAVRRTPDAGADRIAFAHPPPEKVPAALHALLEPGPVRARIQIDNPALPGYVDTAALLRLSPAERQTHLAEVMAQVDAEDLRVAGTLRPQPQEAEPVAPNPGAAQPPDPQPEQREPAVPGWRTRPHGMIRTADLPTAIAAADLAAAQLEAGARNRAAEARRLHETVQRGQGPATRALEQRRAALTTRVDAAAAATAARDAAAEQYALSRQAWQDIHQLTEQAQQDAHTLREAGTSPAEIAARRQRLRDAARNAVAEAQRHERRAADHDQLAGGIDGSAAAAAELEDLTQRWDHHTDDARQRDLGADHDLHQRADTAREQAEQAAREAAALRGEARLRGTLDQATAEREEAEREEVSREAAAAERDRDGPSLGL
jgi:hypothetical protein